MIENLIKKINAKSNCTVCIEADGIILFSNLVSECVANIEGDLVKFVFNNGNVSFEAHVDSCEYDDFDDAYTIVTPEGGTFVIMF